MHVMQVGRSREGRYGLSLSLTLTLTRPCTAVRVGSYAEGFLRSSGVSPVGCLRSSGVSPTLYGCLQGVELARRQRVALRRAELLFRAIVEDEAAPREDSWVVKPGGAIGWSRR